MGDIIFSLNATETNDILVEALARTAPPKINRRGPGETPFSKNIGDPGRSYLHESLEETLSERAEGTAVVRRLVLRLGLLQQRVHI